jgi:hypothetical protein
MASDASELESSNSKATSGVVLERSSTVGRVEVASHVVFERLKTVARVVAAGCVLESASRPIAVLSPVVRSKAHYHPRRYCRRDSLVRCRNNPESSRSRRKCKRTKRKRDENGNGPETENGEK